MNAALRFGRVAFGYGAHPVLHDVSFAVAPGERVALLGRNGAGKTTCARLGAGLARAAAGTVWVGDWDAAARRPEELARRVALVFQHADRQLFARTVRDDVAFGPRALGHAAAEVERRVTAALGDVGLEAAGTEHPYDLPPPLRKLAALASALALAPAVLLLDEPTAGLDRALADRVGRAIAARAAAGAAVIVVTHDLGFAAEWLDRALVLDAGHIAFDGPLAPFLGTDPDAPTALRRYGLHVPPVAALSRALDLTGRPVTAAAAAAGLAQRCRSSGASLD